MNAKQKVKATNIRVVKEVDEYADLSYLGEFSEKPGKFAIKHSDDPREYTYFNAENVENKKQAQQNYKRMMEFNNGFVTSLFVKIEAEVVVNNVVQTISSSGLGGVESDLDDIYLEELLEEQINELEEILDKMGIGYDPKDFEDLELDD